MAAEWSNLPEDLLVSVAQCLLSFEDLFAFGATCTRWRAASGPTKAASSFRSSGPHQAPWLVSFRRNEKAKHLVEIDSLSPQRPRQIRHIRPSSRILDAETVHSSLGWLLTKSRWSNKVRPFNPLSGAEIWLPSLICIAKFVLSASPSSSEDYKVIVLGDLWPFNDKHSDNGFGRMKIWKPGKHSWDMVRITNLQAVFSDMVYHDGLIWALEVYSLTLLALKIDENPVAPVRRLMAPEREVLRHLYHHRLMLYVVESEGEILVVRGDRGPNYSKPMQGNETVSFRVYKVRDDGEELERMLDLGDRALFLGNKTSSFSVKASDFSGCEANCIYFAEDNLHRSFFKVGTSQCAVVGIFSLTDGIFKGYLFRFNKSYSIAYFLSPLWVQPTL